MTGSKHNLEGNSSDRGEPDPGPYWRSLLALATSEPGKSTRLARRFDERLQIATPGHDHGAGAR
jgi:hypothetical protein